MSEQKQKTMREWLRHIESHLPAEHLDLVGPGFIFILVGNDCPKTASNINPDTMQEIFRFLGKFEQDDIRASYHENIKH